MPAPARYARKAAGEQAIGQTGQGVIVGEAIHLLLADDQLVVGLFEGHGTAMGAVEENQQHRGQCQQGEQQQQRLDAGRQAGALLDDELDDPLATGHLQHIAEHPLGGWLQAGIARVDGHRLVTLHLVEAHVDTGIPEGDLAE